MGLVFDYVELEADRVIATRRKDFDLYLKQPNGTFEKLAEAYDEEVSEMIEHIFKRKRLKYYMTFQDGIDVMDTLTPIANKMLRVLVKAMNYGNTVKGYSIRDMIQLTRSHSTYVQNAIKLLCEKDIIRFTQDRNKRVYMVNPTYYYKGSIKKLFAATKRYKSYPHLALDGSPQYNPLEDDNEFDRL
jgi:hypothetical protein